MVSACFALDAVIYNRYLCSTIAIIDPQQYQGELYDVERKAHSETQGRSESGTGTRCCRFVVAGGWRLGRDGRGSIGGPADAKDRAESSNHPWRGRAFRRQPVDLLCLRQGER
jgi:hypothetical protein